MGGEGFTFKFVSQWWKGSFLYFFVNGVSFIVGRKVAIAKDALDMFRFFFTWAIFSAVIACAFDTPGAVKTVGLGMSIPLTFATLRYVSLRSSWFKPHLSVI